jgi:hypothetical protein
MTGLLRICAWFCKTRPRVRVNSVPLAQVRNDFLSFTMDGHSSSTPCYDGGHCWANGTLQSAPFEHPRLLAAARHLSPAKLRLGGSPFNGFKYDFPPGECEPSDTCINATLWDRVAKFAIATNNSIFFDLNYQSWKYHHGGNDSQWNTTNAASLMQYTVRKFGR